MVCLFFFCVCWTGMRYGQAAVKVIAVHFVRNYILSTPLKLDDLKFRMNITLHLVSKHLIQLKRRDEY